MYCVFSKYGHLVTNFRTNLMKHRANMCAEAVHESERTLNECVGFIDGTKIHISRPSGNLHQRSVYSGRKKIQCLSYQTITTPDG